MVLAVPVIGSKQQGPPSPTSLIGVVPAGPQQGEGPFNPPSPEPVAEEEAPAAKKERRRAPRKAAAKKGAPVEAAAELPLLHEKYLVIKKGKKHYLLSVA